MDGDNPNTRSDAPWTGASMPCVYCGRLIPRGSDRCPQCKTSYSRAVRQASREIEGQWFYLEPRNPSNRGVDLTTMLKLIEKGRLKLNSIVRGPTTHQDWMFAAETPVLSKHLGVCPHCFAEAGESDEFCPTCHRHLDERPARLRPGVDAPGAEGYFPDRDATEETLAAALVTHDMARVASSAVQPSAPPVPAVTSETFDSGYHDVTAESTRIEPAARRRIPIERLRAKPHIVALLTVVTVIPLAIIIMYLPLEHLLGDPDVRDSMAYNFRRNRLGVQSILPWSGGDDDGQGRVEDESAQERLAEADRAAAQGRYEEAITIYGQLVAAHPDTPLAKEANDKRAKATRMLERRQQQQAAVLGMIAEAKAALEGGDHMKAKGILDRLTPRQSDIARAAGVDLMGLRGQVTAAQLAAEAEATQQKLRQEVGRLIGQAADRERKGNLQPALTILEGVANKYPREYLPQGYDLEQRIASLKQRINKSAPVVQPKPPSESPKQKADRLWAESQKLHDQGNYDEAIKRLEDVGRLPQSVHPDGLKARIEYLKKLKWFGR